MAFRWRADDDPTLKAGLVALLFLGILASIAKKPYIFMIFRGGGGVKSPCPPSGSAHVRQCVSIPMGTDYASLAADLFLLSYEINF